jgi:hypothetical protein
MPDEIYYAIMQHRQNFKKTLKKLILMSIFYTVFIIVKYITNPNYKEFNIKLYLDCTIYKLISYMIILSFNNNMYHGYKILLSIVSIIILGLFILYALKVFIISIYYRQILGIFIYSWKFHICGLLVYDAIKILGG